MCHHEAGKSYKHVRISNEDEACTSPCACMYSIRELADETTPCTHLITLIAKYVSHIVFFPFSFLLLFLHLFITASDCLNHYNTKYT